MKNFTTLGLIAAMMCCFVAESNALTTQIIHTPNHSNSEIVTPLLFKDFFFSVVQISEVSVTKADSNSITQDKLNYLYSICIALVLFNLIAQIKIIYQMIHLFFQFRKKEDVPHLTF